MTILADRQQLITLIDQATNAGASLHIACSEIGISRRTYRRWKADNSNQGDKRTTAIRPIPSNKLSDSERQAILDVCNEPRFASLPPSQIVPTLLDEGIYHASESSFYRIPHCQNSCHPHPNNLNGGKGDNHGTIQSRTQTSNTKQTAIA